MTRTRLMYLTAVLLALALTGCKSSQELSSSTSPTHVIEMTSMAAMPSLSAMPPMAYESAPPQPEPKYFALGAGDALGQEIFVRYVAYVRANRAAFPTYATGQFRRPDEF